MPAAPPAAAANESTRSTRLMPGTSPSGLARPACSAIAVAVPIVSKKSVSMIEKIVSDATRKPSSQTSVTLNWPSVEKSGTKLRFSGNGRQAEDVGDDRHDDDADEQRGANLQHEQDDRRARGRARRPTSPSSTGKSNCDDRDCRGLINPAIHEADEQDEEADPDADRALQGERHGVHDRLPQADDDEQQDDRVPRGR